METCISYIWNRYKIYPIVSNIQLWEWGDPKVWTCTEVKKDTVLK